MKISKIYNILNQISPFELQEKWDNSGINIGSSENKIKQIILSLDTDSNLIDSLKPNTLLITHHPLIFTSISNIDNSFPSNLIKKMIKKDISLIAMHTNFDKTHLNKYVLEKILKFKEIKKEGFVSYANTNISFDDLVRKTNRLLNLNYTKVVNSSKKQIKTIALTTGSGASAIKKIKADCFLTGDIKYHDAMCAKEIDLAMIDIGHFESEIFFGNILSEELKKQNIKHKIINSSSAFTYSNKTK